MSKRSPTVVLIKRKRKRSTCWMLRWSGSDGGVRTESLGPTTELTERQAGAARDEKAAALIGGTALRDPSRISVSEFLEADRDDLATIRRPATVTAHLRDSTRLLNAIGDMALDSLGWKEVARFKKALSARGCRPASIASAVSSLKAAWNRALKRKLVVENPWVGMKVKVQAKKKRIFTADEIGLMLDKGSPWWAAFIGLAYATGLRLGEILNLTWEDVDRMELTVTVNAHHGSGTLLEWEAKNHHQRVLPIRRGTLKSLLAIRDPGSPYLFLSPTRLEKLLAKQAEGKLPDAAHWLNNAGRDFKALQTRCGLDPLGSIHDLRKSFGTRMARGVTMPELKTLMGHASITTTADFYVAVPDDLADRVRQLQDCAAPRAAPETPGVDPHDDSLDPTGDTLRPIPSHRGTPAKGS